MKKLIYIAMPLIFIIFSTTDVAAAPKLAPGYYTQLYYVLSATVTGNGSCIDAPNTYFTQQFYYPGASKNGATEWRAFSANGLLENEVIALPETPAANATTWSGSYTATFLPGGSPVGATFSITFTTTDSSSNLGTGSNTYPTQAGGSCTETYQFNNLFTGKS